MSAAQFPDVVNGVAEEDIGTVFFESMTDFDTATLLSCRSVSKRWRDAIDPSTSLWNRMSLMQAVKDNRTDITCRLSLSSSHSLQSNLLL